jgi:molecular chaperone DnaJ
MAKDYYKTLGVERDATEEDIKKAFRRLALEYHPDRYKGDRKEEAEERFKEINEAYAVLKDPEKRAQYDRFGAAEMPFGFGVDFQDFFGDIFADFFGERRRPGPEPGADIRYDLEIDFNEAVFGTAKKIEVSKTVVCPVCRGSRAKPGTSATACPECKGRGQVFFQQAFLRISRTCSRCEGSGRIITASCEECRGEGIVETTRTLTVNIPAGVDTGHRLKISAEGDSGRRGGPPGDLYVFLTVKEHPIFRRVDGNIICEVPVSFPQAALGAEIEVPSLEGPLTLKIPSGTQSGKTFKFKGKGAAMPRTGKRGDFIVEARVETPVGLNKRQKELLEELARVSGEDTLPRKKSFLEKVKELFGQ